MVEDLDAQVFSDFIGFCRYVVLMPEDCDKAYRAIRYGVTFKGYIDPVSKENEAAAWKHLQKVVDAALAEYPTTLKEDKEIIERDAKEDNLGLNKKNCVLYRMSEKKVLHFLKDCITEVEEMLRMTAE